MTPLIQVDAPLGMIQPLLIVCGVGFLILIADLILSHARKHWTAYIAMALIGGHIAASHAFIFQGQQG